MAEHQQVPGGLSEQRAASAQPNVQEIVDKIRRELETKSEIKFTSLEVVSFKSQVVAGTNYFVKTKGLTEAGEQKIIHLTIYQHFSGSVELKSFEQQEAADEPGAASDVSVKSFMDKVKVMVGSPSEGQQHQQKPGGLGQVLNSEPEVQEIVDKVRRELETKSELKLASLEVISYRSQIVAGTNYYVKTKGVTEAGDEHYIHLAIYRHFSGTVQLTSFELNKTLEDHLEPLKRTTQVSREASLDKKSANFSFKFGPSGTDCACKSSEAVKADEQQEAAEPVGNKREESPEVAGDQKPAGPGAKFRGLLGQVNLLKDPGEGATKAQDDDEQQRPGGLGKEEEVVVAESDSKVHELVEKVKPALEAKSGLKFTSLDVISFKTQLVAGTNYFVKAKGSTDAGNAHIIHLRIYNRFTGTVELTSYQLDKKLDDKIEYFD